MNSLSEFYAIALRLLDTLLGWLLWWPRDLAILFVAAGTALIMTLARKRFTNQDLLRRCAEDVARLKSLLRDARRDKNTMVTQRLRGTMMLVKTTQLQADLRVLIVVIVPVAMLAMWAAERFDYNPPRVGEELRLHAYYPVSSIDRFTHLVPNGRIEVRSPAVQTVHVDPLEPSRAIATWCFVVHEPVDDLTLTIRHENETVTHHVRVGRSTYLPARQLQANDWVHETELELRRYSFLGLGPRRDVLGLAPWLVVYLVMAVPLVPLLRKVCKVF